MAAKAGTVKALVEELMEALMTDPEVTCDTSVVLWREGVPCRVLWSKDQDEDGEDVPGSMRVYIAEV